MTARAPRLGERLHGRDNNLNLLRMTAATAVMFSHAFALTPGGIARDPVMALTGQPLAFYAVALFFGISGLLVARSWDRRPSAARFIAARALRLYPALAVVLVLTVLAGLALTTLSPEAYLGHPGTAVYIPSNLALANPQYALPGVFAGNPAGPAINGSLWTLFYEVVCYAGVLGAGLAGLFARPRLFAALLAAAAFAHVILAQMEGVAAIPLRLRLLAELALPFSLGALGYLWRHRLPLSPRLAGALWVVAALGWATSLLPSLIVVAVVYSALVFAFAETPRLRRYNRLGDYSYGTYIYAFPMQQLAVWLVPGQSPPANLALAFPATLALAMLSWHLVEARALAHVAWLSDRLARLSRRARAPA